MTNAEPKSETLAQQEDNARRELIITYCQSILLNDATIQLAKNDELSRQSIARLREESARLASELHEVLTRDGMNLFLVELGGKQYVGELSHYNHSVYFWSFEELNTYRIEGDSEQG